MTVGYRDNAEALARMLKVEREQFEQEHNTLEQELARERELLLQAADKPAVPQRRRLPLRDLALLLIFFGLLALVITVVRLQCAHGGAQLPTESMIRRGDWTPNVSGLPDLRPLLKP